MRNPPLFWADVEREEEELQPMRCLRGWVCGGEGSGGLVELFGGVVGGGDLVVASFGPK